MSEITYALSAVGHGSYVGRNLAETGSIFFQSRLYDDVDVSSERKQLSASSWAQAAARPAPAQCHEELRQNIPVCFRNSWTWRLSSSSEKSNSETILFVCSARPMVRTRDVGGESVRCVSRGQMRSSWIVS